MEVYRIVNLNFLDSSLSGIGAEKYGGRWNEIGTRAVYCSENASLALLEYYIHSENIALLPKNILLAKIQFPDDFELKELTKLPANWNDYPYTSSTTKVFTEFAKDRDFFGIKVPSTIIGVESNIILNPLFKDFGRVEIIENIKLPVDDRLRIYKR